MKNIRIEISEELNEGIKQIQENYQLEYDEAVSLLLEGAVFAVNRNKKHLRRTIDDLEVVYKELIEDGRYGKRSGESEHWYHYLRKIKQVLGRC